HIMPWAKRTNPIIQKAAKSGKFHINDTFNGINLNLDVHKGYSRAHWLYDTRLQNVLDEMNDLYANESASFVYNKLATLVNQTRSQLVNGKTLDQVIFITP
ncbi:MAG: HNH endonuclease, partial [Flavobacteriaceae bacterium]|nr:HNH endonuclease [Flavobacteriaceae bacterium]